MEFDRKDRSISTTPYRLTLFYDAIESDVDQDRYLMNYIPPNILFLFFSISNSSPLHEIEDQSPVYRSACLVC